jgi:hypothetical protein
MQSAAGEADRLTPPDNFCLVEPGIYRYALQTGRERERERDRRQEERTQRSEGQASKVRTLARCALTPTGCARLRSSLGRCGFPVKKNFSFLKTLGLRTILYLCPEEYPEANLALLTSMHVQLLQYGVAGNKVRRAHNENRIASEYALRCCCVSSASRWSALVSFGTRDRLWQEPFIEIPHDVISAALVEILDTRNHPLLIHCNKVCGMALH